MGRQIIFHMLPQDCAAFLRFAEEHDAVVVTEFTAGSADVLPVDFSNNPRKHFLCLWNKTLLPSLTRKYVPESTDGPYYRVDSSLPILELFIPVQTIWDGRPALTQGRLYAYAYQNYAGLKTWYEALARWLKKNFKKTPIEWMSGYTGPAAYDWYENGGLLLPSVQPPVNPEWRTRIHAQHPPVDQR